MDEDNEKKILRLVPPKADAVPSDNVAEMAEQLATDITMGKYEGVTGAAVVMMTEHGIELFGWGPAVQTNYDAIVMFSLAKHKMLEEMRSD
jgi:hypothetical protein